MPKMCQRYLELLGFMSVKSIFSCGVLFLKKKFSLRIAALIKHTLDNGHPCVEHKLDLTHKIWRKINMQDSKYSINLGLIKNYLG